MSEKSTKKRKAKTAWAYGRPKAALRKREAAIMKHKTAQEVVPQAKPDGNAWFSFPLENWRSSMFTSLAPVLDQVTKTVAAINPLQEQEDSIKQPGTTAANTIANVVQHSDDHVPTTDLDDQRMSSIESYTPRAPSVVAVVSETDQVTFFDQENESQVPSGPVLQLAKASLNRSSDSALGSTALTKKTSMASNIDLKSIGLISLKSAALSKDLNHAKKFSFVPHSTEAIRPFIADVMSVAPASFAPVCDEDTQLSKKVKPAFSAKSSFSNDPCVVCPADDDTANGMNEKRRSRELGKPSRENTDSKSLPAQLFNKETKNQSGVLLGADIGIPDKALRTEVHDNVPLLDPMCPVSEEKTQAEIEKNLPVVPEQRVLRYSVLQQTFDNVKVMEVSDKRGSFLEKTANTPLKERLSQQVLHQSFASKAAEEKSPVQSNVRQRPLSSQSWSKGIDTLQSASYSDTCLAKQAAVQNKPTAVAYHDHDVENTQETLLHRQRSLRFLKQEAQLLLSKDLENLPIKKAELKTRQTGFDEQRIYSAKQSWKPPEVESINQHNVSLTEQNQSVVGTQSETSVSSFSSSSLHDTLTRSESGQTPFPMRTRLTQAYVNLMTTSIVDHPTFPTLQTGIDNSKLAYRAVSSTYQEQPQRSAVRPSTLLEEESSVVPGWAPTLKQRIKTTFLGQNAMAVNAVTVETRNTLMEDAFSKQNVPSQKLENRSGMTQKETTEWKKAEIPQSIASQSEEFQTSKDSFQIDREKPSLTKRLSSVSNGYLRHEATPRTSLKDVSSLKKPYTTSENVLELKHEAPAYSSGTLSEASNNLPDEVADQRFKLTTTRPQKSSCEIIQSGHIKAPAEYLTRRSVDAETNASKHRDTLQAETSNDFRATATTNPPQRDFTTQSVKQGETLDAFSDATASEKCEDQKIRHLDNEAVLVEEQESKVAKLEQAQLKKPQEVLSMLSEPNHSISNLKAAHRVSHQLTKEKQLSHLLLPPLTATEPSDIVTRTPETFYLLPKVNVLRKNETPSVPLDDASLFALERRRSPDTQEAAAVSLDMRYVERQFGSGISSTMPLGTSPSERQTCHLGSAETTTAISSSIATTDGCIPRLKKANIRRQETNLLRLAKQPLSTYAFREHSSKAAKCVPLQHENPIRQEAEREPAAVRQVEPLVKPQVKLRTATAQKNENLKLEEVKVANSLSDNRRLSMRSGKTKSVSPTTVPSAQRDVTAKSTMKDFKNMKRPTKRKVKSVGKPQAADLLPCLDIKAVLNLIDAAESETQSLQAVPSAKSYASTSWLQLSQELVKNGNVDAYSASVPRELLWLLGANALFGPPSEWNAYLRTIGAVFCRRLRLKETQFVELQRLISTAATKAEIGARAAAILPDLLYT